MSRPPQSKGEEPGLHRPHASIPAVPVTLTPPTETARVQRTTPLCFETDVGRGTLPSISDARPTNAPSLSRQAFHGTSDTLATSASSTTLAANATATASKQMTWGRPKLMQKVAARLAKVAVDRQSNVFPLFLNDPETQQPCVLPEEEKNFLPEKRLLMAPNLGIAAGANAMGGYSQRFAMSREEAARWMKRERDSNRLLFSWWEARNACRQDEEEIAAVVDELRGPLWTFFRQTLTEEEAQCVAAQAQAQAQDLSAPVPGQLKPAMVKTKPKVTLNGRGPASSAVLLTSSERGILMSLELYERTFRRVLGRLHRNFLTLLRCHTTGSNEIIELPLESLAQGTKYVRFLLESQLELVEAEKLQSDDDGAPGLCLPVVSIPEERCFRPMLEVETAFAVTLLWRILDQTKSILPGMTWALQLYTRYVLPHVYEKFSLFEQQLPKAGAIGEQVEQLYVLPLNLVRQRAMIASSKQAKEDVRYMEGFLKSWAWRTWRRGVVGQRRREVAMEILEKRFRRLYGVIRQQKCFAAWRLAAKEGRFAAQLDAIDARYNAFFSGAQHAARDIPLFPGMDEGLTGCPNTILDKNRFVALKLAETAQHTKARRKSVSIIASESAESQGAATAATGREGSSDLPKRKAKPQSFLLKTALKETPPSAPAPEPTEEVPAKPLDLEEVGPQGATFITSVSPATDEEAATSPLNKRAFSTFDVMLKKLQEMETISGYLRQEIAIQNSLVQKLERENNSLKSKTRELEESLFNSEEQRLQYSNLLQERELDVRELERRITQLKSRLRCQRHRPWQRTVMRVVGAICGACTTASEYADDCRIARKMTASGVGASITSGPPQLGETAAASASYGPRADAGASASGTQSSDGAEYNDGQRSLSGSVTHLPVDTTTDEERLFGKLAPLVIVSTRDMPDAQNILRDWANGCLEDLESLDDLKGGALSSRFHQFSDEVRNGVLFSRLLFYLALPRYQNKTAVAPHAGDELKNKASMHMDFTDNRRHLLMQQNVQLESPFPTYSECFGDLLNLKPSGRMALLLQFATELMEGAVQLGDEYIKKRMLVLREAAMKATEMTPLPPADRVELLEIVDPYALSRGDRSATLTFIALLYVRFAHPFNHKARQSALIEREAMLYLLSGGAYSRQDQNSIAEASKEAAPTEKPPAEDGEVSIARRFLAELEEEDRTPWQLFMSYCRPLINTMAHPFILRGNFWPNVAFDSPELARILGSLGLALHRSLEAHRWHITISCLVPVQTYSGLSRGVFTGRRASAIALQVGLERDGDWAFAMELPCIQNMFQQRGLAVRKAISAGTLVKSTAEISDEWNNESEFIKLDKSRLLSVFGRCSHDLLQLFLQRGSLAESCAMPALDLGSWRLLWLDLGLVNPENTESSLLDLEQVTRIFCLVTAEVADPRRESRASDTFVELVGRQQLPPIAAALYFPEFLAAVVLLAHEAFPLLGEAGNPQAGGVVWLADALTKLVFQHIAPILLTNAAEDPSNVMRSLRANVKTQQVLIRQNKALLVLFNSYCKEVCGVSGMEREQLLQMLRDAMLTSTDISQNLIYELFMPFSVTKKSVETAKEEKRREQDARPRDMPVQRRRANVSIVDPAPDVQLPTGRSKEATVLLYDGFIEFLCVLCHFKQPNPLIPFDQRLETFLRRGLLRPLAQRNDALSAILSVEKTNPRQDA
ncbi:uncharacterized protein Tco025E_01897 [Trypanosoma conorhini]|uniref:Uncharacterized protein n=1 Tax=Trypanosoma conorhini TaxID=83891 RepID=A0A422Q7D1_9TRYP|nr:uncharacterized protein Tco025E_01897 [Trypanosoma conorhini]RNF25854.1 hypothetical protein Tco025E_01897 [Trypanosoma conorhini]